MKGLPTFDDLRDNTFEGIFFKDEGDFLIVKFEKETKKIPSSGLHPWGFLASTYLTKKDLSKLKTKEELLTFLTNQI